jgi:hypothetical protein
LSRSIAPKQAAAEAMVDITIDFDNSFKKRIEKKRTLLNSPHKKNKPSIHRP